MSTHSAVLLIVLLIALLVPGPSLVGEANGQDRLPGLAVLEWRITRIEPATKQAKEKEPTYLGSILVTGSNPVDGTVKRMWLRITTETKITIAGQGVGEKFEVLETRMRVAFSEPPALALMDPPIANCTELRAWHLRAK
jgi:hypothetical protein